MGVILHPLPFPSPSRLLTLGDQVSRGRMGKHDPGLVSPSDMVT